MESRRIRWREVRDLVEVLLAGGADEQAVIAEVAAVLDAAIPVGHLGVAGAVVEVLDGPAIRAALRVIVAQVKRKRERAGEGQ